MKFLARRLLCGLAICWSPLLAAERDTLGTRTTASGDVVRLQWTSKHPWDKVLTTQGLLLFIEYRSDRGVGVECLMPEPEGTPVRRGPTWAAQKCAGIRGVPVPGTNRAVAFRLPARLTAEPQGKVCLQFRLGDQRPLPLRRADGSGVNTTRFEHADWARVVTTRARRTSVEADRQRLVAAIAAQTSEIGEQQMLNESRGWTLQSCNSVDPGFLNVKTDGRPVAPPSEHDRYARILCIRRLSNPEDREIGKPLTLMDAIGRITDRRTVRPELLRELLNRVKQTDRARWESPRKPQWDMLNRDWTLFRPVLAKYQSDFPVPHFESSYQFLPAQTLTQAAATRIKAHLLAGTTPDSTDILGVLGATLEAYHRCVSDGEQQLALNYGRSVELRAKLPTLQARIKEDARRECRAGLEKLASMKRNQVDLERRLADAERRLREIEIAPISTQEQTLGTTACEP